MGLEDIQSPKYTEIELLVGNDNASLQLKEHQALNGLSRPENLVFKHSPIMLKPVAVGRIYGQQTWTEENLFDSMKKEEIQIPKERPEKEWAGFEQIRSVAEIKKDKRKLDWDSEEDSMEEFKEEEEDIMEEVDVYMASTEEQNIEEDINIVGPSECSTK